MRIYLHIGLPGAGADRLSEVLAEKREQLIGKGVLFPRSPGAKNHTRLYMAATDPDHIDTLRFNRGFITAEKQDTLRQNLISGISREIEKHAPDTLILSASQLGASLARVSELQRLQAMLAPFSDDIRIVAHVDEQARLLIRYYAHQVTEGRAVSLEKELKLAGSNNWWGDTLLDAHAGDPQKGQFLETQSPAFWLDYRRLVAHWESVFGAGNVTLRGYDEGLFHAETFTDEIRTTFGIKETIGKASKASPARIPSAAWLTRGRLLNELILKVLAKGDYVLPRQLWKKLFNEISTNGVTIEPGALAAISKSFAADNMALLATQSGLNAACLKPDTALENWSEAGPERGFRASQYLLSFMWRIEKATRESGKDKVIDLAAISSKISGPAQHKTQRQINGLSDTAKAIMPELAQQNYEKLKSSSFAPHNRMGRVNEEELAAAYSSLPMRSLPEGNSGNVIVGCMKNEAPYIVEWVAYHRAMGVDNFLIYTNDCSDGTSEILDRLQEMGVLQHRNNDNWKGNSPQQHALNSALKEQVIKNAEWIIHIDVDEFINVRCGNGTLADFFERVPEATNVAMTWRLFGHNGVAKLADDFVVDQFDTCAPKFCPKPHTVWGFKTMFRNIGAYEKISCHRPNKLDEGFETQVKWVNGSGHDMGNEVKKNGWRNSKKSIGYDLLQLNHYALRSAESFLIKRQRGRALHVDRSIGLNYWIRMDWSDFKDITIKRNIPRLREEYDRLMSDDKLRGWHEHGLDWHRTKAAELHKMPEFQELYDQALRIKLNETERVAYALALDMES